MRERRIVDAFVAGDAAGLVDALEPGVTFHSPVADYVGRERAAPVLRAVLQVVRSIRATSVLEGPGETVAFFTAELEGRRADGVLRVAGGDVTLMVRPLRSLLAGIERMKELV